MTQPVTNYWLNSDQRMTWFSSDSIPVGTLNLCAHGTVLGLELTLKLRPIVSQPVYLGASLYVQMISVWQLWVSWCGAPSLTRGWVCNLLVQLLLGLARAVTLWSKSRRTHEHILLSHLRLLQPGVPGWPSYPQAMGFLFIASYESQGYVAST
jgi:hypothetical protein